MSEYIKLGSTDLPNLREEERKKRKEGFVTVDERMSFDGVSRIKYYFVRMKKEVKND